MKKVILYNGLSNIMLELIVWMIYLKAMGWSTAQIALLESAFTLGQVVFEFPTGIISDKIGHKLALLIGEGLSIFYLMMFFFAQQHVLIYCGLIAYALGLAFISGTDVSLLYESVPENERKRYLKYSGYFNMVSILAVGISNFIGGYLAKISWHLLFIIAIIIRSLAFIVALSINKEDFQGVSNENFSLKQIFEDFKQFLIAKPYFIYLILLMCTSSAAVTISYQYGPLMLKKFNLSVLMISLIFGLVAIIAASVVSITYKLTKLIQENQLALLLQTLCLVCFLSFIVKNVGLTVGGLIFINIAFEIWNVIFETKTQNLAYENIRATSVSAINLCESIILTISSWIISLLGHYMMLNVIVGFLGGGLFIISIASIIIFNKYVKE